MRKQDVDQPSRVLLELAALCGRVSVSQDQEIHFFRGRTMLLESSERAGRRRSRIVDELILRVNRDPPDLLEEVAGVALSKHDLHGRRWRRETKRFGKSPGLLLCLRRSLPFAVDRREAAG